MGSYLSFENTIQDGYVTEKLLETLALPTLPVYYGAPNVPNITISPSFIKATDFKTPESLATYLLYLDANPIEYNRYHEWRNQANPFDDYYLKTMRDRVAGPLEIDAHNVIHMKDNENSELNYQFLQRRAQCCRLCDENTAKQAKVSRTHFIPHPWDEDKINRILFSGKMNDP